MILTVDDLNWLYFDLKAAAKGQCPPDKHSIIDNCAIGYKDSDALEALLKRHPDVAFKYLPDSSHALRNALLKTKQAMSAINRQLVERVAFLHQETLRQREIQSRLSVSAIRLLNQGWVSYQAELESEHRAFKSMSHRPERQKEISETIAVISNSLGDFARARVSEAFSAEGLIANISLDVVRLHSMCRILAQVGYTFSNGTVENPELVDQHCSIVLENIRKLQSKIGDCLFALYPSGNDGIE